MSRRTSFIDDWVARYLQEEAPRSKSLIVSVFGDSIAPLAAGVWLGELIALMAPFGVNERLVRTSAFRLVDEHWLEARRDGRRSHYSLTASGVRRFEHAYGRIYTPPPQDWDGSWSVVLLPRNGEGQIERQELRRELEWEGYASPAPGVMFHPAADAQGLQQLLTAFGIADRTVVFRARAEDGFPAEPLRALVDRCWNLQEIGTRYRRFIERFQPLPARLDARSIAPEQAFLVQTLLIHSFRRASLHDPRLPAPMLPPDWPGREAFDIARQIYLQTFRPAQTHLRSVMELPASARPTPLGAHVRERFGGLR